MKTSLPKWVVNRPVTDTPISFATILEIGKTAI